VPTGQPGVTALCVLAYLSRGHLPGEGPYGGHLDKAIEFVLSCQQSDGLIAKIAPPPQMRLHGAAHTGAYNHAISGLMLAEVYGMTTPEQEARIGEAIKKALAFTRARQIARKRYTEDRGGWRYLRIWPHRDSDMSVTSWHLMFLRSARNSHFEVPSQYVDEGMAFVRRCFDSQHHCFVYSLSPDGRHPTRGIVGAGVLSLSLGGLHQTEIARAAGDWILRTPFSPYNRRPRDPRTGRESTSRDRYHYSVFYCTQAMFQLGGRHWAEFYPRLLPTLLENQGQNGSWQAEAGEDHHYGNVYTTALTVLALSTPYQLLPIYQR